MHVAAGLPGRGQLDAASPLGDHLGGQAQILLVGVGLQDLPPERPAEGVGVAQPAAVVQTRPDLGEVVDQHVPHRAGRQPVAGQDPGRVVLAAVALGRPHRAQRRGFPGQRAERDEQLPRQVLAPVPPGGAHQIGVGQQVLTGQLPASPAPRRTRLRRAAPGTCEQRAEMGVEQERIRRPQYPAQQQPQPPRRYPIPVRANPRGDRVVQPGPRRLVRAAGQPPLLPVLAGKLRQPPSSRRVAVACGTTVAGCGRTGPNRCRSTSTTTSGSAVSRSAPGEPGGRGGGVRPAS